MTNNRAKIGIKQPMSMPVPMPAAVNYMPEANDDHIPEISNSIYDDPMGLGHKKTFSM